MIFVVPAEKPDEILHALYAVLIRLVLHLGKAIYQDQILNKWHVRVPTYCGCPALKIKFEKQIRPGLLKCYVNSGYRIRIAYDTIKDIFKGLSIKKNIGAGTI
jgi:hypothetical protein